MAVEVPEAAIQTIAAGVTVGIEAVAAIGAVEVAATIKVVVAMMAPIAEINNHEV